MVLGEILRGFYNRGELPRVFWWRTSHGQEVDFIVERNGRLLPIEVKLTSRLKSGLARNLESFCEFFKEGISKGILVNLAKTKIKLGYKISSVSFTQFIEEI